MKFLQFTETRNRWTKHNINSFIASHIIDYPTPINLNYFWSFGSAAGLCLVIQILTGIFLAMHYTPHIMLAFNSVEHIMRDGAGKYFRNRLISQTATCREKKISSVESTERVVFWIFMRWRISLTCHFRNTQVPSTSTQKGINVSFKPAKAAQARVFNSFNKKIPIELKRFNSIKISKSMFWSKRTFTSRAILLVNVSAGGTWKNSKFNALFENNKLASEKATNYNCLFFQCFSKESLKKAFLQIQSKSPQYVKINIAWVELASSQLLKQQFIYPKKRRSYVLNIKKNFACVFFFKNFKLKVIEQAILNNIEPVFEGTWSWVPMKVEEWSVLAKNQAWASFEWKRNKKGFFKKIWTNSLRFQQNSFAFRPNRSIHLAIQHIKNWHTSTAWFLEYKLAAVFGSVHIKCLRNIFLKNVKEYLLWDEIEKMIHANIISITDLFGKHGVPQESLLAPFLFNIYLNEFDFFITNLILENSKQDFGLKHRYKSRFQNYGNCLKQMVSTKINSLLTHYALSKMYSKDSFFAQKKKLLFSAKNIKAWDRQKKHIQYVRYADIFLIGLVGLRRCAQALSTKVTFFLKSSLHLLIQESNIKNRADNPINFVGFSISFLKINLKMQSNSDLVQRLAHYKKRIVDLLRGTDARAARAGAYAIKHDLLKAVRISLNTLQLKWTASNREKVIKRFIATWMMEGLQEQNDFFIGGSNQKLRCWEQHFQNLFFKQIGLNLKFFREKIMNLKLRSSFLLDVLEKINIARDIFLRELDLISLNLINKNKTVFSLTKRGSSLGRQKRFFLTKDLVSRIQVKAPLNLIFENLKVNSFYHLTKNRPIGNLKLIKFSDAEIINFYSSLILKWLNWYRCVDNFYKFKSIYWVLRKSCIFTLAIKHAKSKAWVYKKFGYEISFTNKEAMAALPSRIFIENLKSRFLSMEKNLAFFFPY